MSDKKDINLTIGEDTGTEVITESVLTYNLSPRERTGVLVTEPVFRNIAKQLGATSARPVVNQTVIWYGANTYIHPLHEWQLPAGDVTRSNMHGMHIYLYEPICMYYEGDPSAPFTVFNSGFYSEFDHTVVDDWDKIRAAELDSISHFVHTNGLTNVTVHTGDYNADKLSFYSGHMNLICDDSFLNTLTFFDHVDLNIKPKFEKRFLSTNWRFTTSRCIISSILSHYDADQVWYFHTDPNTYADGVWFSWEKYKQLAPELAEQARSGLDILNSNAPVWLDMPATEPVMVEEAMLHWYPDQDKMPIGHGNPASFNQMNLPLQPYYRRCFVDVINESRYAQPTGNISEKVLQCMHQKTPYIMVGPAGNLEYLHSMGYKTFSKWWDESYDTETDPLKRLAKIHQIIIDIANTSLEELYAMYLEMQPVLEHNLEQMIKNVAAGKLADHRAIKTDIKYTEKQWVSEDTVFKGLRNNGE